MTVNTRPASGRLKDTTSDNRFLLVALAASCLAISLRQSDLILGVVTAVALPLAWRRRLVLGPVTILIMLVLIAIYGTLFPRIIPTTQPLGSLPWWLGGFQIVLALGAIVAIRTQKFVRMMALLAVGVGILIGALTILGTPDADLDVIRLHVDAARVLTSGGNPYADISVMSDPTPDREPFLMTGYPYPPVPLVGFAASEIATGDPRWAGLVAHFISLVVPALATLRSRSPLHMTLTVALAANPGLPLVLEAAWTETFTVALLVLCVVTWEGKPVVSALALGAGLASKQYLGLLAPFTLSTRLAGRRRWIALGAILTTLPAVLPDPVAFYRSAIAFHFQVGQRSNTGTLGAILHQMGSTWRVPTAFALGVSVLVGIALARRSKTLGELLIAVATVLAVAFALGAQAFPNYFYLLTTIMLLAVTSVDARDGTIDFAEPSRR